MATRLSPAPPALDAPRVPRWTTAPQRLAEQLHPLVPAAGRGAAAVGAGVFLLASLGALLRVPVGDLDTLWAEDGRVFLQDALDTGTVDAVTTPYSGYLHLWPRLAAELATALPLDRAGVVASIVAALAVGLAAWTVWTCAAGLLPSPVLRGALTAAVVLVPAGALEAVDNVANSHFYLVAAAFWALLGRRAGSLRQALPVLVVVLAALSDPVAVVLLPLALSRLVLLRGVRDRVVPVAYLLALAGQLAVVAGTERATGTAAPLREILFGYALRVVSTSVVGMGGTRHLVDLTGSHGVWALAAVVLLALVALTVLARDRLPVVAAGLASAAFFAVACLFALGGQYPPAGAMRAELGIASRYTIVPALLLVAAVLLAVQRARVRLPRRAAQALTVVVLLPVAFTGVLDFRAHTSPRDGVGTWSAQVEQARLGCLGFPPDRPVVLTIAPADTDWTVTTDCATVTG